MPLIEAAALLVAAAVARLLPVISLPSMAMVGRALRWRVTAILAGAVMVTGLAGAVTLWALS